MSRRAIQLVKSEYGSIRLFKHKRENQIISAHSVISAGVLLGQDGSEASGFGQQQHQFRRPSQIFMTLDADADGVISAAELKNASTALLKLDKNGDGQLTAEEVRPNFQFRRPPEDRDNHSASPAQSSELVQTLMSFDRNGDGKLLKDELPHRMQGLLNRGDINHDGFLSKDEIQKLAQQQQATTGSARDGERGHANSHGSIQSLTRLIPITMARSPAQKLPGQRRPCRSLTKTAMANSLPTKFADPVRKATAGEKTTNFDGIKHENEISIEGACHIRAVRCCHASA